MKKDSILAPLGTSATCKNPPLVFIRREYQDSIVSDPDSLEVLQEWKTELNETRVALKNIFNPSFGSVFRSRRKPTFFSRRLFRVADVYTSRVTNFANYPITHTFYPRRGVLPHEFKSWFV